MNDRRQLWEELRKYAEQDEVIGEALRTIEQFEEGLDENDEDEFEAANLKLPYSATEEPQNEVWK